MRDGSFLAVAGPDEYAVIRAAEGLFNACDWEAVDGLAEGDVFESLTANTRESRPVENDGVPQDKPVPPMADPPTDATATLEARYDKPYHAHASMGPQRRRPSRLMKVCGCGHTAKASISYDAVAEAFGIDPETVRIEHVPGAGCYGHNGADDAAFDAAIAAQFVRHTGPTKWTREEEHAQAPYATATSMKLRASIDTDGQIIDWNHETYGDTFNMRPRSGPNMSGAARLLSGRYRDNPPPAFIPQPAMFRHMGIHRNLDPLYAFPQKRLVKNLVRDLPLRTSALRTLGAFGNVFALESFMDELANAAGIDPVTFRLNHLEDARGREVLEAVAARMDLTAGRRHRSGYRFCPERVT